jgi:hypothetical protein
MSIQSAHSDQQEDALTKITSLEKHQFIHVLERRIFSFLETLLSFFES